MSNGGRLTLAVIVATFGFASASAASASTIQVTTTSDDPVSSGCSLRDAISSANTDTAAGNCAAGSGTDTIVVPSGSYRLTDTAAGFLNINRPVTISGAGPSQTIIDGNNTNRVFLLTNLASGSTIEGVTITHGHAPDGNPNAGVVVSNDPSSPAVGVPGEPGGNGGGISTVARLTLSDCIIDNNRAGDGGPGENAQGAGGSDGAQGGGGGGAQGGTGGSGGNGGGVYSHSTTLTITNCRITNNVAGAGASGGIATGGRGGNSSAGTGASGGYALAGTGGIGGSGGGVYIAHNLGGTAPLTISTSVIDNNTAGAGGASNAATGGTGGDGAVGFGGGDAGVVNSTDFNSAPSGGAGGSGGLGGGVFASGTTTITDSDVSGNTAGGGHAGAAAQGSRSGAPGSGTLSGNILVWGGAGGNGGAGGGIFSSGTLTLARVGLTADRAGSGGSGNQAVGGTFGGGSGFANIARGGAGGSGGSGGGLGTSGSQTRSVSDLTVDSDAGGTGGNGGTGAQPANLTFGGGGGAAGQGGGIDNEAGAITVTRSTISANTLGDNGFGGGGQTTGTDGAPGLGGGIDGATATTASATVFSGNDQPQCAGSVADGGNNLDNPASSGCPGTVADPHLGALADNGGNSPTRAIPATSPAVNAYTCTGLDQRGATRPAGPACDIGAYEFAPPLTSGESVDRGDVQVVAHATITPNVNARVTFNYGRTKSYGSSTPTQTITGSGPRTVSATITGLSRSTTYHFRVTATNSDGTTAGGDVTFTTLSKAPPGGNPTALKLTKLSVKPGTFAAATPRAKRHHTPLGTTIRYTLSAKATVTLTFLRRSVGKRSRGRCVATRHAPSRHSRCYRYTPVASFTHTSNSGAARLAFSGVINKHALPLGTYRLTATARAGREHSRAVTVTLTVVKR